MDMCVFTGMCVFMRMSVVGVVHMAVSVCLSLDSPAYAPDEIREAESNEEPRCDIAAEPFHCLELGNGNSDSYAD
jgi:hypothetical protein